MECCGNKDDKCCGEDSKGKCKKCDTESEKVCKTCGNCKDCCECK